MHTNTHKRRLEAMEKISELLGKVLYDFTEIQPRLGTLKQLIQMEKDEDRTKFLNRFHTARLEDYNQSLRKLGDARESAYIYTSKETYEKLREFCSHCSYSINLYCSRIVEEHVSEGHYQRVNDDFDSSCIKMTMERDLIVDAIKLEMHSKFL